MGSWLRSFKNLIGQMITESGYVQEPVKADEKPTYDVLARQNEMERFIKTYFSNWSTKGKHQD